MNKKIIVVAVLLLSMCLFVGCAQPSDDIAKAEIETETKSTGEPSEVVGTKIIPIDAIQSSFEFEGYTVGKSHIGTFTVASGSLAYDEKNVLVSASGTIDAATVDTGIGGLDTHLKSDDFFDVEQFATIEMVSSSITYDAVTGEGEVTGDLTFHGVTKSITFPVTVTEDGLSTDFLLDTTPFNMKYLGVDKEVRIAFNLVAE